MIRLYWYTFFITHAKFFPLIWRQWNLPGYFLQDVIDYKSNFHLNLPVVCTASLFHLTVIGSKLAQEIHNKINLSVKFQFITKIITLTSRSDASITNSFASRNSEEFLLENYFQFIKFVYKKLEFIRAYLVLKQKFTRFWLFSISVLLEFYLHFESKT